MNYLDYITYDDSSHKYYFLGIEIPSVTQILRKSGFITGLKYIDPIYADRGSFLHLISEEIDKNGKIDYSIIPPEWLPFVTAYEWFKSDTSYDIEKTEYIIFDPVYLYCGRADREYSGSIQGDIKTGYYQSWHELQLAAYMHVTECQSGIDIYLSKDGYYKIRKVKDINLATDLFLTAANGYWFSRKRDRKKLLDYIKEINERRENGK